jgi:hypothetical protein
VSLLPEHIALLHELGLISQQMMQLQARRDELIEQCIAAGHSERAIGEAAGVSGPAIHQRKERGRA